LTAWGAYGKIIKHELKGYFPKITIKNRLNLLCELKSGELEHSKILGSILNPKSAHGYKDIFLI